MKSSYIRLAALVLGWGLVAVVVAASGLPGHTAPGVVPALVLVGSVVLAVATARAGWLREALDSIPLRGLVGFNAFRFVGAVFLWFAHEGRIPQVFADRAGWGDIATAAAALVLVLWPAGRGFRRAVLAWNVFGTLDLVVAVGTAAWLTFGRRESAAELVRLPLALIPLWAVPMMLAVHATIFRRVRTNSRTESDGGAEAMAPVATLPAGGQAGGRTHGR